MANDIVKKLADLFKRANEAAIAADPGEGQDGGTCNLDSPAFRIERGRKATIEAAAAEAGVTVYEFDWFRKKWFWLNVACHGQANRRTTMVQAAGKVLREAEGTIPGFHASVYYQMD